MGETLASARGFPHMKLKQNRNGTTNPFQIQGISSLTINYSQI